MKTPRPKSATKPAKKTPAQRIRELTEYAGAASRVIERRDDRIALLEQSVDELTKLRDELMLKNNQAADAIQQMNYHRLAIEDLATLVAGSVVVRCVKPSLVARARVILRINRDLPSGKSVT